MITPRDEAAYHRWLYGNMGLIEAFALYRMELENDDKRNVDVARSGELPEDSTG